MASVSLEIYPEPAISDDKSLRAVNDFVAGNPIFVSVTSSPKQPFDASLELCSSIKDKGHQPALHLLCGNQLEHDLLGRIDDMTRRGITKVVALRGDPPVKGEQSCDTVHLVSLLKAKNHFDEIAVAGYPDKHPEAADLAADIEYLMAKVRAGATRVITQFCYDVAALCRFRDRLRNSGAEVPISAGLLPIRDYAKMMKFARKCKTEVAQELQDKFKETPPALQQELAAKVLEKLTADLVSEGFDIHYYTLNSVKMINEAWLAASMLPDAKQASS